MSEATVSEPETDEQHEGCGHGHHEPVIIFGIETEAGVANVTVSPSPSDFLLLHTFALRVCERAEIAVRPASEADDDDSELSDEEARHLFKQIFGSVRSEMGIRIGEPARGMVRELLDEPSPGHYL